MDTNPEHDYYQILGITQQNSLHEIKVAYRRCALIQHPDKNLGDPKATAAFQLVCYPLDCFLRGE